ncbi:MAG: hydroxymethylpyrimidine/phosphomethylpyrimidine kinase, partial [Oscillospiraceae bacterium]
ITPNIPEAEAFTGMEILTLDDMENAAAKLLAMGANNVLIKGGHMDGLQAVDFLLDHGTPRVIRADRVESPNTHGTGCTLSSAIAVGLAHERSLFEAVRYAKRYITLAIENSYTVGKGHSPVNHFFELK